MINKEQLRTLLIRYQLAENQVRQLDTDFGICVYNSHESNFYNELNIIIRKLLESIYGEEKTDLIESFVFEETNMTFDELYNILENE